MNKLIVILSFILLLSTIKAQQNRRMVEGKISYLSSQNIYVKFGSTNGISIGDTLFTKKNNELEPVLVVKYISSKSCSGTKLFSDKVKIGATLLAFIEDKKIEEPINPIVVVSKPSIVPEKKVVRKRKKDGEINGRIALSSYGNISNITTSDFLRWRYTFSARSQNFRSSKFSFDSYISFNYRSTEWNYIKSNISDALKIYSLSVKYDFNENLDLTVGRRVNRSISNIGAIDGVQLEGSINNFKAGLLIGSRPDYLNYSYNFKYFEYGGFINHSLDFNFGNMQNSFALFQQTNNFKTDRRFLYFQHTSSIINKVNLFFSSEVDLFKKEKGIEMSTFSLTGLYLSFRYRPSRIIGLQASYDSRKNVIYYESFQNYADSLYENATRQGVRFRVNIKPLNNLYLNFSYGYHSRAGDLRTTQNISGNLSYSNVPFIAGSFGVSYNNLVTSYLSGNIYGLRYSRDLINGVIYSTFSLRRINYNFVNGTSNLEQTVVGIDMNWSIIKHLSLSLNYEGTFENINNFSRLFFNITKRF